MGSFPVLPSEPVGRFQHILLRPDTYIGSVEPDTQKLWIYDGPESGMVFREITFVPGLYKIFDEILVNAADNKQRDKSQNTIKVSVENRVLEHFVTRSTDSFLCCSVIAGGNRPCEGNDFDLQQRQRHTCRYAQGREVLRPDLDFRSSFNVI